MEQGQRAGLQSSIMIMIKPATTLACFLPATVTVSRVADVTLG